MFYFRDGRMQWTSHHQPLRINPYAIVTHIVTMLSDCAETIIQLGIVSH